MKKTSDQKLTWRRESLGASKNYSIELVRCPAKGGNSAIILTDQAYWIDTHYWRGKTQPCTGPVCPGCRANAPIRELGYIAIMHPRDHVIKILQITHQAWHAMQSYLVIARTMRGATITQIRPDGRKNGRVKTTVSATKITIENLPEAPDVRSIMEQIWEISDRTTYVDLHVVDAKGA